MKDRFFVRIGSKFCQEIEPDFEIVEHDYFLFGKSLCYKIKGQNKIQFDPTYKLLKNPEVKRAVGRTFYRIIKEV